MLNAALRKVIAAEAGRYDVGVAQLLAVVDVESAGTVLWTVGGKHVPPVRPEGHYFYKRLSGDKLKRAVAAGLAHPKAGGVAVPRTRAAVYAMVARMEAIDRAAARESCSWGAGQVMGAHWAALGYRSADDLVESNQTAVGQVDCMMRYVIKFGLLGALRAGGTTATSWRPFAKGYNGSGYAKGNYHGKMATAFKKYWGVVAGNDTVVKVAVEEEVLRIQRDLSAAGYYSGKLDGIDGPKTRAAIKALQRDSGLVVDGKYGSMTDEALQELLRLKTVRNADRTIGVGGGTAGIGAAGETIVDTVTPLQYLGGDVMQMIVTGVILIGVGLIVYGLIRKFRS